jgi:hypothetical protein
LLAINYSRTVITINNYLFIKNYVKKEYAAIYGTNIWRIFPNMTTMFSFGEMPYDSQAMAKG